MSFNILPAQRSDIPQIISVANHAFGGDAIVSRMMPDVPAPEREKWDHGYWEQEFDCIHINGMKVYKAVDDAGYDTFSFYFSRIRFRFCCFAKLSMDGTRAISFTTYNDARIRKSVPHSLDGSFLT